MATPDELAERLLTDLRGGLHTRALDGLRRLSAGGPRTARDVLSRAAREEWSAGRLAWAVRLTAATHAMAAAAGEPTADVEATLRALRSAGGPVPLGPLLLTGELGAGATGRVFTATWGDDPRPVAVKVVHAAGDRILDRFEAEVRTLASLDHPSITWLLDRGVVPAVSAAVEPALTAGMPWLATPLAGLGSADVYCGHLTWDVVRHVLLRLLDALAYSHARGVLHLDLKPGNVLLSGDPEAPEVRLADFGLAVWAGRGGRRRAGTPAYMAPEQFLGVLEQLGPWTDLYALGVTAWELVCGSLPFTANDPSSMRSAHVHTPVPPLAPVVAVPEGLEAWVRRLLHKEPGGRFRSAAAAARELAWLVRADRAPAAIAAPFRASELTTLVFPDDVDEPTTEVGPRSPPLAAAPIEVLVARPATIRPDPHPGLLRWREPRWVARVTERRRLWNELRGAFADGVGRSIALTGAPGVGRSRLGRWVAERAAELDVAHVLTLADSPVASLRRFWGVGGLDDAQRAIVLRQRLVAEGGTPEEERVWAAWLSGDVVPTALLATALRRTLTRRAAAGPWVVWADDPAHVDVVARAVEGCRAPVFAVVTGGASPRALAVDPLPADELEALVRSLVATSPELAVRIARAAGGSPRRASTLLRDVVGAWTSPGPDGRLGLDPEAPADLFGAEPDDGAPATPGAPAVVAVAALGPRASPAVVDATLRHLGLPASALDEAAARGDLRLDRDGVSLSEPGRAAGLARSATSAIHRACADGLAEEGGDPVAIGEHRLAAGDLVGGLTALAHGGSTRRVHAGDLADRAVRDLPPDHPARVLAHDLRLSANPTDAGVDALEAAAPGHGLTRLWRGVLAVQRGAFADAVVHLRAAREALPLTDLHVDYWLAAAVRRSGDLHGAAQIAEAAAARSASWPQARAEGVAELRAGLWAVVARCRYRQDDFDAAEAALAAGREALGEHLASARRSDLAHVAAEIATGRGDDEASEQGHLEAIRWASLRGDAVRSSWVNVALLRLAAGRVPGAIEAVDAAAAEGPPADASPADTVLHALSLLGVAHADDAQWGLRLVRLQVALPLQAGDAYALRQALDRVADVVASSGRPDRGREVRQLAARWPRRPAP